MATTLFQTPQEIASTTIMGGNVDGDRYRWIIAEVQNTVVLPLLGQELYDKIYTEATANTLAGLYLTLYTEYVKPLVKNETCAQYIEVANLHVVNGGIFTHTMENGQAADAKSVAILANRFHSSADTVIQRFNDWISLNPLTEYKTTQDGVNSQDINRVGGWWLER